MLGHDVALAAVQPAKMQRHFAVFYLGALRSVSEPERHTAHNFVFDEPTAGWSKSFSDNLQTKALGQIVKDPGCVRVEARFDAGPQAGVRVRNPLPPGARFARGHAMKLQIFFPADKLHIRASFLQE